MMTFVDDVVLDDFVDDVMLDDFVVPMSYGS